MRCPGADFLARRVGVPGQDGMQHRF
jgi:hypothetical protein